MKCVVYHNYVFVKSSPSHVQNYTLEPCCQSTKLKIMTISIMIKVLIKFRASETVCVDFRGQKAMKRVPFTICTCQKLVHLHTYTSTMSPINKAQIMIISFKIKVFIKLRASEVMFILEAKKAIKCVPFTVCTCQKLTLTCAEYTTIVSPVSVSQNFDYMNIKIKVRIKFGPSEVMCVDLRARKL